MLVSSDPVHIEAGTLPLRNRCLDLRTSEHLVLVSSNLVCQERYRAIEEAPPSSVRLELVLSTLVY